MFDSKKFGMFIARLRKNADMTQSELAERLNLTRQAISKYECGDSFPDVSILITIADVFDVTLDELIYSGEPTSKEADILEGAAHGEDLSNRLGLDGINDFVNIAPFLKPSVLDNMATGLALHGINISSVISLAKYLNDDTVIQLLEKADYGELDYRLMIPYADYIYNQVEVAVLYGGLNRNVFYYWSDFCNIGNDFS